MTASYPTCDMAAYEAKFLADIIAAETMAIKAEFEVDIDLATMAMDMMFAAGGSPKIPNCYAPRSLIDLYARMDDCERYVRDTYDYVAGCYATYASGIKPKYVSKHIRGTMGNQGVIL